MAYTRFEEFRYEVDRQFRIRTGCTASKLGVKVSQMKKAFKEKTSPRRFVTGWIKKHNLTERDD